MANGEVNNYTLGRGEVYFARYKPGTTIPAGERYLGNTPEFALTIEEEKLEHFSSDRGIREKDASISLQVNRTGSLTTDNINPENVALFFFGSTANVVQAGGAASSEFDEVEQSLYYQLGVTAQNPSGVRGVVYPTSSDGEFTLYDADTLDSNGDPDSESVAFVEEVDYNVEAETGRLYIVPGGGITNGTNVKAVFEVRAHSERRILSGSTAVEGALRFVARNPKGELIDYYMPYVQISPNGDYALKGDEWQQIPFNIEVLTPATGAAILANGRPVYA